jgi:hypothetical protein
MGVRESQLRSRIAALRRTEEGFWEPWH